MLSKTSPASSKSFLLAAAPLFLVLFIDSMGLGLVFHILNALIVDSNATFISASVSSNVRNIIFGSVISLYMFCWFFGAAFLGDLSDQIGRKKGLLICLLGAVASYFLSALAVTIGSISLILMGRVIAGFTAGSQSIAQAAIVDISTPEHKARNLGWILFVMSLGFIFGPLAGGVLSDHQLFSWFNYTTPFYFAAIISLLNTALLLFYFQETFILPHKKLDLKFHHAIRIFISAFTNEKVRELSVILLIMIFGWSGFYSFVSMYLMKVFHLTPLMVGCYMGVMGIGFGLGTGFLVEPCTKHFSIRTSIMGGAIVVAVCTLITVLVENELVTWLTAVPIAASAALVYSCMITLFSNQVDAESQGWIMGITGAIMAFAFGLNALVVSLLTDYDIRIPMMITVLGFILTAVLIKMLYKGND